MRFHDPAVIGVVVALTAIAALMSTIDYSWMDRSQYVLLAVGTIVVGIPHGAADNHICRAIFSRCDMRWFYWLYILAAAGYGALWVIAPTVGLLLFLVISVYHFGQSNLFYVRLPERSVLKKATYLLWGTFYLAPPILYNYDEASLVITSILGYSPIIPDTAMAIAPVVSGILVTALVTTLAALRRFRTITALQLARELASIAVLFVLFVTAPLYVSFIVYWAFWHSSNSALEITTLWDSRRLSAQVRSFFEKTWPLTLVTGAGMALIFTAADAFSSRSSLIAVFFIIVAAVTLPHAAIMEGYYRHEYARRTGHPGVPPDHRQRSRL